jgi:1-pyrroline-5-carboxylate dehydrogenase
MAFQTWQRVPVAARARMILRIAALMRRRKAELAAWIIRETSKTWSDADAEVARAIDFCEYYARCAWQLQAAAQPLIPLPGEQHELHALPLGVGVIITPWNAPLATLTGMTVAAIVVGNSVVLTPNNAAPITAAQFMQILEEAGLPPGVVNYLPVLDDVYDQLIGHAGTRFVAFTGSSADSQRILRHAAVSQLGQSRPRAILELRGQNTIIVDESADLQMAARSIVANAFGFQGQQDNACARVIITERIYEQLLSCIADRTNQLKLGNPAEPEVTTGAVIDAEAFARVSNYIAIGQEEGRLVIGGEVIDHSLLVEGGYFINPTVFADVSPDARIAQEDIWGPVLACLPAHDFDHALELANAAGTGLTGVVYARAMERLEQARASFQVSNLYLNPANLTPRVGVQPAGGLGMSGQPGGPHYLRHFVQDQIISERL